MHQISTISYSPYFLPLRRIPRWTKAISVILGTLSFLLNSVFIGFYIYWLHWIVSKPISYSRITIMNSFFFVPYSNLQNKIKRDISLFKKNSLGLNLLEHYIFCFLFSVLTDPTCKYICASKLKFEVKIFCINDFSNFQSTFITSFPLHTICEVVLFSILSVFSLKNSQSLFLLTEGNRAIWFRVVKK